MVAPLPPPDPAHRAEGPAAPPAAATGPDDRGGRPAWAIPLVVAAALLLAAIVGYSLAQGLGDDDDGRGAGQDATAWNAIASVDVGSGVVTLVGRDGAELDTIEPGIPEPTLRTISNRQLALVGAGRVAMVDLADGTSEEMAIPDGLDVHVTSRGAPRAFFGTPTGGAALVPTDDGGLVDVAAAAGWEDPLILPERAVTNPSGSHLAVDRVDRDAEAALVAVESGDVTVVPGLVVALDDDGVTTQRPGDDATVLERFDLDGESQGSIELGVRPVAVLGGDDGQVVAVTAEGGILLVDPAAGDSEELGQLDIDQDVDRVVGGTGSGGAVLVLDELDDEHAALHLVRSDGSSEDPVEVELDVRQVEVGPADGCVALSTTTSVMVIRLADGGVAEQLEVEAVGGFVASADACTVAVLDRDQRHVVTPDGVVELARGRIVALSPDGAWVAVRTDPDGEEPPATLAVALQGLDDGAPDPATAVALPGGFVAFVEHG